MEWPLLQKGDLCPKTENKALLRTLALVDRRIFVQYGLMQQLSTRRHRVVVVACLVRWIGCLIARLLGIASAVQLMLLTKKKKKEERNRQLASSATR